LKSEIAAQMKQQQSARGIAQRISQWQLLGTMTGSALQRTFSGLYFTLFDGR
jgi:hypothetical protein